MEEDGGARVPSDLAATDPDRHQQTVIIAILRFLKVSIVDLSAYPSYLYQKTIIPYTVKPSLINLVIKYICFDSLHHSYLKRSF